MLWHQCPIHGRFPAANREFWQEKFSRNLSRDRRVTRALRVRGGTVLRIEEHDFISPFNVVRRVGRCLSLAECGFTRSSVRAKASSELAGWFACRFSPPHRTRDAWIGIRCRCWSRSHPLVTKISSLVTRIPWSRHDTTRFIHINKINFLRCILC